MGIEPTTSGLDLPLLCRLSYEVGQRKSGTIVPDNIHVVIRSLTSARSRRSRFMVVETLPVNERTFQSCSCNILVFTWETYTGKESFEQARISTYHFYIGHIRTAINSHDLLLERGGQSSRSSPEVCLQKASRNLTRISSHFLETEGAQGSVTA